MAHLTALAQRKLQAANWGWGDARVAPWKIVMPAKAVSSTRRLLGSIIGAGGILDRPVPSTPRLRRARGLWAAEALAKAANGRRRRRARLTDSAPRYPRLHRVRHRSSRGMRTARSARR